MAYTARVLNPPKHSVNYTILPRSEIDGFRKILDSDQQKRIKEGQEERERLKQQSDDRVKNWPNTIEATRLKKEADRKARYAAEEQSRKVKDEEDAKIQSQQRKDAIERANLILYEQDDKVKTFNSKMLLSHVLEERQQQIASKQTWKTHEREREREWEVKLQEQLKLAKEDEDQRKIAVKETALAVQTMQQEQLAAAKKKFVQEREERKREGDGIRRAAERAVLQEIEEEKVRKSRARDLAEEYYKANAELEKFKSHQARKEEEETLKIQRFAQLKEEQMMERKRRADDKFKRDMERRQMMIERQADFLQHIHSQEEERIHKQIEEKQIAEENKAVKDRERRKQLFDEIQASRKRQQELKDKKKERKEQEELAFRQHWTEKAEYLLHDEIQARREQRDKLQKLQGFQKMQAKEKEERLAMEKRQEKLEGQMVKQAATEEGELFKQYVNSVMTEYAAKGLDLTTLKEVRARHLPL